MVGARGNPVILDVFSDVVCPWCYIGKRRLEQALALVPETPVEVRWRPYFLNDWVPREGMTRTEYLVRKFGSVERYAANIGRMAAAGEEVGLRLAFERIARQPNTIDCHRLLRWAAESEAAAALKERLMAIYFVEGGDLSSREILLDAAEACGLDRGEMERRLASDQDEAAVTDEANAAKAAGIDGVPCFIFANRFAVSGAQPPELLASAIRRAGSPSQPGAA